MFISSIVNKEIISFSFFLFSETFDRAVKYAMVNPGSAKTDDLRIVEDVTK